MAPFDHSLSPTRRFGFGALAVALVLAGCDDGADESLPLEDLPAAVAQATCDAYTACVDPQVAAAFLQGEDCVEVNTRRLATRLPSIQGHLDDGTVIYDGGAAGSCVSDVATTSCAALDTRYRESCESALSGQVAVEDACTSDVQCEGNSYCDVSSACPGTCARRSQAGGDCTRDNECDDGLVCSSATSLCAVPNGEGDACGGGVETQCTTGLFCVGADVGVAGECKSAATYFVAAEGETCDADTQCAPGLVCAVGDGGLLGERICEARVESGAACKLASPEQCPDGEYCQVAIGGGGEGTCAALPGDGEACAVVIGRRGCAPYTRCDGGTCRALREVGETCSRDELCWSQNCVAGACRPAGACQ